MKQLSIKQKILRRYASFCNYFSANAGPKLAIIVCVGLIGFFVFGCSILGALLVAAVMTILFLPFFIFYKRVSEVMLVTRLSHTLKMSLRDPGRYDSYDFEDLLQRKAAAEDFYAEFVKAILDCGYDTVRFKTHGKVVENVVMSKAVQDAFDAETNYIGEDSFTISVLIMTHGQFVNIHPRKKYSVVLKKKPEEEIKMELTINRQSVCMADDICDHAIKLAFPDDATYEDVYGELKRLRYFPSVSGNNVVWVMKNSTFPCIFSYFTFDDYFSPGLAETSICNIDDGTHRFELRYYSSPEKWKKQIIDLYDGNLHDLYHDGWLAEIEHCERLSGTDSTGARN